MLTETILAAIEAASATKQGPASTLPVVKDAGIYHLELRPHFEPRTVFKKSSARSNCVTTSEHHVFAAQADKAVVHVYVKGKGNQELTVPFGEKVTAAVSAGDDGAWIICGTESGAVLVWETYSGRLVRAQQSHVQAVTAIAVDKESKFFVTGSADSTLLVWSLATILTYAQGQSTSFTNSARRVPKHTLTAHRASIVGLAMGHSKALSNFVVSIAEDKTAMVWHVASGTLLRTYLLLDEPRTLTLDPADRACYVGYPDGTVQVVDFYAAGETSHLIDESTSIAPRQANSKLKWKLPAASGEDQNAVGPVRCMALSLDGTKLLTGHQCGRISTWEVGSGRYDGEICILPGPVTNLQFLRPAELSNLESSRFKVSAVVKSKIDTSNFFDVEHAQAFGDLIDNLSVDDTKAQTSSQGEAQSIIGFDNTLLWEGIQQLQAMQEARQAKPVNGNTDHDLEENTDFIWLGNEQESSSATNQFDGHETEADFLRQQVRSLQNTQKESFKIMREMRRERELLMQELDKYKSGKS